MFLVRNLQDASHAERQTMSSERIKYMKKRFCNKIFKSMLATGTVTVVIQYLILLSDTLIIGNLLGEQYLGAINIVKPIYSVVIFFSTLISVGTSVYYSYNVGMFRKKKANCIFSQGIILAIAFGLFLQLIFLFGKNAYLDYLGVSAEIRKMALDYYFYYQFVILLVPFYTILLETIYADGDQIVCNSSCIAQILTSVINSIVLCKHFGILGVGLGTLSGVVVSILILSIHFFRKCNNLKFIFYVSLRDTLKIFKSGMTDASAYLFLGLTSFVASKFVISQFSEYYLPVLLGVFDILELTMVFDGVGQAITPIVNVYRGEENRAAIQRVMKSALFVAAAEGVILTTLLCIFGKQVSYFLGMRDGTLIEISTLAIRLVSPFFFCSGILFLQTTYYMIIGKEYLATAITGFKDAVVPIVMMCSLGHILEINGVWIGLGLSPFVSIDLVSAFLIFVYGRERFPLLFGKEIKKSYVFDIVLNPDNIPDMLEELSDKLTEHHIDEAVIQSICNVVRESANKLYKMNPKKEVLLECSLLLSDTIEIILRDSGTVFDPTAVDEAEFSSDFSGNTKMIDKKYMVTVGCNREIFVFERARNVQRAAA